MSASDETWLIWSNEHTAWWKSGHLGYTRRRSEAGTFSREEAEEIVRGANLHLADDAEPYETMVPR